MLPGCCPGSFFSYSEGLFESEGFFYAKPLFKGTIDECLAYPNEFQSKIAEWLGYPAIEDNICEGIVIRPVTPHYLRTGSRALIKEMSYDVVEDFLKEYSALYNVIDKSEVKIFNKELNKMISALVKKVYVRYTRS